MKTGALPNDAEAVSEVKQKKYGAWCGSLNCPANNQTTLENISISVPQLIFWNSDEKEKKPAGSCYATDFDFFEKPVMQHNQNTSPYLKNYSHRLSFVGGLHRYV